MTPQRAGLALLVLSLLAAPAAARAELYAAISGGVSLPSGNTRFGSLDTQITAALAVGYDAGYVGGSIWAGFVNTSSGGILQQNAWPVLARARGRLPLGIVAPFVHAGVGFAPARLLVNMVQYDTVAFVAQLGGGADFLLGDLFTLGVEAGYQWLKPDYGYGMLDTSGVLLLATLGLRFP